MDTIMNYLETMFVNMPNTPEVLKAKDELGQMMEDKYNELIAEGKSANAAVGQVIAEFGNLEELSEELGLKNEYQQSAQMMNDMPRRQLSLDECSTFLKTRSSAAYKIATGVALCISCVCGPIITDALHINEGFGVLAMFLMIAIGVVLFIMAGFDKKEIAYIRQEACSVDVSTCKYLQDERKRYRKTYSLSISLGVFFIILCWLPVAVIDEVMLAFKTFDIADLFSCTLFLLISIGVFLIIESSIIGKSYDVLLGVNDVNTIGGSYRYYEGAKFKSKKAETFMELYWPTVSCVYFCWSFLTFNWFITWIIWPIAAVIRRLLIINLKED